MAQLTKGTVQQYKLAEQMAATESRKTPLHINAFWENKTIMRPLLWEKWAQRWNLALLAQEWIQLEFFLNGPPTGATYPHDRVYVEPVENHTKATKRDKKHLQSATKCDVAKQMQKG